ncbi:hypothetical protein M514_24026 [Trichuris suis]|uniref:Uncharacterized protein n=1 Tax=Trichuris suis TaxID=68888 RepID=A0A085N2S2_9BILA|nr:hypothetical protein M514_24026 [Trichuris suis]
MGPKPNEVREKEAAKNLAPHLMNASQAHESSHLCQRFTDVISQLPECLEGGCSWRSMLRTRILAAALQQGTSRIIR